MDRREQQEDQVAAAVARARWMIDAGAARIEVLTHLANAGEALSGPGATVSILVLDGEGLLRNGASPNLPPDYLAAAQVLVES